LIPEHYAHAMLRITSQGDMRVWNDAKISSNVDGNLGGRGLSKDDHAAGYGRRTGIIDLVTSRRLSVDGSEAAGDRSPPVSCNG